MTETEVTAKVVAPFTFPEGYVFDTTVDGKTISVTVPSGGVVEGDIMEVDLDSSTPKNVSVIKKDEDSPITGEWRSSLFSCCEVLTSCLFWASLCGNWIVLGQLMQRMKLNFAAIPDTSYQSTFKHVIVFTGTNLVIYQMLSFLGTLQNNPTLLAVAQAMSFYMTLILVYWGVKTRNEYRQKYDIPGGCCSDFCTMIFCSFCALIQMARHTHNEDKYPYDFYTTTGLSMNAPEIV